jgi:hypothetical protein
VKANLWRLRRSPFPQSRGNRLNSADDLIGIAKNLVVPEADHCKPDALKLSGPGRIQSLPLRVLSPVQFHDQAHLETTEIHDELANRLLTSKSQPQKPAFSQVHP